VRITSPQSVIGGALNDCDILRPAAIDTDSPVSRGYRSVRLFGGLRARS
jgi:hypothetical protein